MEKPNDYFFGMTEQDINEYKEAEKRIEQEQIESYAKDQAVLEKVKKQVSNKFYKQIKDAIEESENCSNFKIVENPSGQLQGNMSDEFKEWVDQYTSGEDCYSGYVYIELPSGKYLAWDYWM